MTGRVPRDYDLEPTILEPQTVHAFIRELLDYADAEPWRHPPVPPEDAGSNPTAGGRGAASRGAGRTRSRLRPRADKSVGACLSKRVAQYPPGSNARKCHCVPDLLPGRQAVT